MVSIALLALTLLQPEELVVWHSYRGREAEVLEQAVAQYNAALGAAARVLAVPAGAYAQKLRSAIPFGHGPDLFVAPHDMLGELVERELVAPIDDVATDAFLAETVAPLRYRDHLWAWPWAFKSLALFYRTDLVSTPPPDTDTLISLARALRTADRYGFVYQIAEPYFHVPWLHGLGGEVLARDGTRALLDSKAGLEAAAFVQTLRTHLPTDINGALVTELFNKGRAAMVINGPWFLAEIDAGVPFGVAPLPRMSATGAPARPLLTVEALWLARGRDRPSVRQLASYLTSADVATQRALGAGQPVAHKDVYELPALAQHPWLPKFRAQIENTTPMPTVALMQLVWEPWAGALREIVRGADPRRALAEAQRHVEILQRGVPSAVSARPYVLALVVACASIVAGIAWWLRRGGLRTLWEQRLAYTLMLPTVLGMLLMVGVPFVMGVGLGFFEIAPEGARFVGMQNFVSILTARDFPLSHPLSFYFTLLVTIVWTVANVALHLLVGLGLAIAIDQPWLWGRHSFRVLLILPWAIPSYISALVFKGLFNKELGAINAALAWFGVEPVGWFDAFLPAFAANLTTNLWLGFPFMMVTVLGALQAIPEDLQEAARVDGAGFWYRLRTITLPQVAPALIPAVVLGTLWTFNMFNVVFLVSEGQPEGATDILVTEAYRWAFVRNGRFGYAAAYSVIIFAILLAYGALTRRLLRRTQVV